VVSHAFVTLSLPALFLFAAARAAAPVEVVVPSTPPREGEAVPFTVRESVEGPVFVDGCSPVEVEQKTGGKWLPLAVKVCDSQVPATRVDAELAFSVPGPSPGSGTYRVMLTWGTDCAVGFPLATAVCKDVGSVVSAPFVVAPKQE
jgi:hypothetical protein